MISTSLRAEIVALAYEWGKLADTWVRRIDSPNTHKAIMASVKYDMLLCHAECLKTILKRTNQGGEYQSELAEQYAIVERVEKIVCRMEILPQKLEYTRGTAAEFRDALHPTPGTTTNLQGGD